MLQVFLAQDSETEYLFFGAPSRSENQVALLQWCDLYVVKLLIFIMVFLGVGDRADA